MEGNQIWFGAIRKGVIWRIGNGDCIETKGKIMIANTTKSSTQTIFNALYEPKINQNLFSVGLLIEKG